MKLERTQEWWLARADREGEAEVSAGAAALDPTEDVAEHAEHPLATPRLVRRTPRPDLRNARGDALGARPLAPRTVGRPTAPAAGSRSSDTSPVDDTRIAFGRFVELMRRRRALTVEQLAERADLDVGELVSIEDNLHYTPEPRTVYQLARAFNVPQQRLLQLAGLTAGGDARLRHEAVRFAARSESVQKLSKEERAALEEFVAVLSRQDG